MSLANSNKERKYQAIQNEYQHLLSVKENGIRKFTTGYIIYTLAQKYYLSERQIENIVWRSTITK